MLEGTLATIADELPNGFHDAQLESLRVYWPAGRMEFRGIAWVAEQGPPEVYRPFELVVSGLRTLACPTSDSIVETEDGVTVAFSTPMRIDGFPGWPPDRVPEDPPWPEIAAYSFYLEVWNDFLTVQGERAALTWLGPAFSEG